MRSSILLVKHRTVTYGDAFAFTCCVAWSVCSRILASLVSNFSSLSSVYLRWSRISPLLLRISVLCLWVALFLKIPISLSFWAINAFHSPSFFLFAVPDVRSPWSSQALKFLFLLSIWCSHVSNLFVFHRVWWLQVLKHLFYFGKGYSYALKFLVFICNWCLQDIDNASALL